MIKAALGDIFLQRGLIPFDSHVIKNPPRVFDIKEYSNVARIDRERSEPVGWVGVSERAFARGTRSTKCERQRRRARRASRYWM